MTIIKTIESQISAIESLERDIAKLEERELVAKAQLVDMERGLDPDDEAACEKAMLLRARLGAFPGAVEDRNRRLDELNRGLLQSLEQLKPEASRIIGEREALIKASAVKAIAALCSSPEAASALADKFWQLLDSPAIVKFRGAANSMVWGYSAVNRQAAATWAKRMLADFEAVAAPIKL